MVKIQIDLSEEEDAIVGVYKITNKIPTKEEAVKSMIRYFEVSIEPKNAIINWLKSEHGRHDKKRPQKA